MWNTRAVLQRIEDREAKQQRYRRLAAERLKTFLLETLQSSSEFDAILTSPLFLILKDDLGDLGQALETRR